MSLRQGLRKVDKRQWMEYISDVQARLMRAIQLNIRSLLLMATPPFTKKQSIPTGQGRGNPPSFFPQSDGFEYGESS